jgi:hypothetical protein
MIRRTLLAGTAALSVTVALGAGVAPAQPGPTDPTAAAPVAVAWQRIAVRTIFTEGATPPQTGTLYLAFASMAVDDAAADALRRSRASARAAVATAAHDVLVEYFPASAANLAADLSTTLAAVPDGPPEAKGIRIGRRAAARLVASREDDGRDDPDVVYSRDPAIGVWQPPAGGGMATAWLGHVTPLVDIAPVPTDGPDDVGTPAYAADYDEVKSLGAVDSAARTTAQTDTARFFAFNPPVMYRLALCRLLESEPLGLRDTTRLFATVDAAVANAMIETFRLKLELGYWRPFQAIPAAGDDGNPATDPQEVWVPLVPNPAYPEYTSGHAAATAPFAEVLRRTFGDDVTLRLANPVLGVEREYSDLTSLEHDALDSRVWGGLHFRDAMDDGYRLGHKTAGRVIAALDD